MWRLKSWKSYRSHLEKCNETSLWVVISSRIPRPKFPRDSVASHHSKLTLCVCVRRHHSGCHKLSLKQQCFGWSSGEKTHGLNLHVCLVYLRPVFSSACLLVNPSPTCVLPYLNLLLWEHKEWVPGRCIGGNALRHHSGYIAEGEGPSALWKWSPRKLMELKRFYRSYCRWDISLKSHKRQRRGGPHSRCRLTSLRGFLFDMWADREKMVCAAHHIKSMYAVSQDSHIIPFGHMRNNKREV